jgi:hypothetical protein
MMEVTIAAQTGSYADTESSNHATDEKVPNHVFGSVSWKKKQHSEEQEREVKTDLGA